MVFDPISLGLSVGVPLVTGLLGNNASSGDRDAALRINQQALEEYRNLQIPDTEKLKLYLEQYSAGANFNPEAEALVGLQGDTRLSDVSLDPRLRQTQLSSLDTLQDLAGSGMTAIDRAQLEATMRRNNAEQIAQQKSILQNRAARGMAGGGDELAASLSASQSGANRSSAEALQIAADAMNRRMSANNQAADLASSIEGADYSRQSEAARARDVIASSNARLRQQVEGTNVGNRNTANLRNIENTTNTANKNVDLRNNQQQYNKNLLQTEFDNRLKRLDGMSGAARPAADALTNKANATSNMYGNVGSAAAGIGLELMKQNKKKSLSGDEEDFLDGK